MICREITSFVCCGHLRYTSSTSVEASLTGVDKIRKPSLEDAALIEHGARTVTISKSSQISFLIDHTQVCESNETLIRQGLFRFFVIV